MAFDGITIANIARELQDTLTDARIQKIIQPEADALLLTLKTQHAEKGTVRLHLSANASLPLAYLTKENRQAPAEAPAFCMLLRKHLLSGRIVRVSQPSLERILRFDIEHRDEMGDLAVKTLVIELMGKHSNILLLDGDTVMDAIKRVPAHVSSVREVLPGRDYFIPKAEEKQNPLDTDAQSFFITVRSKPMPVHKALVSAYTGISPLAAEELCARAGIDASLPAASLSDNDATALFDAFHSLMNDIKEGRFRPQMVFLDNTPKDYASFDLELFQNTPGAHFQYFESVSELVHTFYSEKETLTRIRVKASSLRQSVQTALSRNVRKLDLQLAQLKDTEKMSTQRLYGDLLTALGHEVKDGAKEAVLTDYNTGKPVTIPLDETKTVRQNAQRYYERYNKLKRTEENLLTLTKQTQEQVDYLESVLASLDLAKTEEDLVPIREELVATGYLKHRTQGKQKKADTKGTPYHYRSSDGFSIYVGRNNYQNDYLTMKLAKPSDWWFHAKKMPGSHVILKTEGRDVPDRAFEEAAALAAFYSKAAGQEKVEVDYLKRSDIKKPSGAVPGFVVYYTNYSMVIAPDISALSLTDEAPAP